MEEESIDFDLHCQLFAAAEKVYWMDWKRVLVCATKPTAWTVL